MEDLEKKFLVKGEKPKKNRVIYRCTSCSCENEFLYFEENAFTTVSCYNCNHEFTWKVATPTLYPLNHITGRNEFTSIKQIIK